PDNRSLHHGRQRPVRTTSLPDHALPLRRTTSASLLTKARGFLRSAARVTSGAVKLFDRLSAMIYRFLRTTLLFTVFTSCIGTPSFGQATSVVQISGVVTDSNGGVISGAQVKATQTDTGLVRTAETDSVGAYVVSNLPIGPYRVEASANGFRTYVQTGI